MEKLEMKIDGEQLLIRHPGGVTVLVDFSGADPELAAGAAVICGVKLAAKPAVPGGNRGSAPPPPAVTP